MDKTFAKVKGRLPGFLASFAEKRLLRDMRETVIVTITEFTYKSVRTPNVVLGFINFNDAPIYSDQPDGLVQDKEHATYILKVSRLDPKSPDERLYIINVTAESHMDAYQVCINIVELVRNILTEDGLLSK